MSHAVHCPDLLSVCFSFVSRVVVVPQDRPALCASCWLVTCDINATYGSQYEKAQVSSCLASVYSVAVIWMARVPIGFCSRCGGVLRGSGVGYCLRCKKHIRWVEANVRTTSPGGLWALAQGVRSDHVFTRFDDLWDGPLARNNGRSQDGGAWALTMQRLCIETGPLKVPGGA